MARYYVLMFSIQINCLISLWCYRYLLIYILSTKQLVNLCQRWTAAAGDLSVLVGPHFSDWCGAGIRCGTILLVLLLVLVLVTMVLSPLWTLWTLDAMVWSLWTPSQIQQADFWIMRWWGHYPPPPPPPPPPPVVAPCQAECVNVSLAWPPSSPLVWETWSVQHQHQQYWALTYNDTNPALPCPAGYFMGGQTWIQSVRCETSDSDCFLAVQRKTLFSFVSCDVATLGDTQTWKSKN